MFTSVKMVNGSDGQCSMVIGQDGQCSMLGKILAVSENPLVLLRNADIQFLWMCNDIWCEDAHIRWSLADHLALLLCFHLSKF